MADYDELTIGPFVGGLNTLSDQTSIQDTELFVCDNLELDQDGSLKSRPPVRVLHDANNSVGHRIIGYFVNSNNQAVYPIVSTSDNKTYYLSSGNLVLITDTFAASACIQYRDALYLVAPLTSPNPGGTWVPNTFTPVAAMPKGEAIVQLKDRLWIAQGKDAPTNGSRVYVTDIENGVPTWKGNFINVSQGDGQNVVDLCVYNSDLLIFKQSSTYRFSFGTDVATGALQNLSQTIGATDTGCWTSYEQQLFVVFNNNVYEFTSYLYNKLNTTVPLDSDNPSFSLTEPVAISAWSDRVFVTYFDKLFVYNLRNRTWSTWSSTKLKSFGRFFPVPFQQNERPTAYLYSTQPAGTVEARKLYVITDAIEPGTPDNPQTSEEIRCTFETKNYDYQSPSVWKRLRFWGADVLSKVDVSVWAQPVQFAQTVSHLTLRTDPAGPGGYKFAGWLTNKAQNSNLESGSTAGWVSNNGTLCTLSLDSVAPISGSRSAMTTRSASSPSSAVSSVYFTGVTSAITSMKVVPGENVTISADLRTEQPNRNISAYLQFRNAAGSVINHPSGNTVWGTVTTNNVPANQVFRAKASAVAPENADSVIFVTSVLASSGNAVAGERVWFDNLLIGPDVPYFNGDSVDAVGTPAKWDGPVNNSTSTIAQYVYQNFGWTHKAIKDKKGTYQRPLEVSYVVSDEVDIDDLTSGRKFIKFWKSIRFRQISFKVQGITYGTSETAPIRVYRLSTFVKDKSLVSKKIN